MLVPRSEQVDRPTRAHYGKPEGIQFQPCLEAVRAAVKSGNLVVPFSVWNTIESLIPQDAGRRKRLAEFMVDLSGNKTVLPESVVVAMEIVNAARQLFGMPPAEIPARRLSTSVSPTQSGWQTKFKASCQDNSVLVLQQSCAGQKQRLISSRVWAANATKSKPLVTAKPRHE